MLRLRKCASIASHPSTPSDSGARRFDRCPDIAAEAQAGSCGRRVVTSPRCVRNDIIEFRTLQTDAVSRTRHLQRADCHADRFGDLLTAHSALDQIPDLLEPCRREFDWRSVSGPSVGTRFWMFSLVLHSTSHAVYSNMTIPELVRFTSIDFWRFHGLGIEAVDRVSKRRAGTPSLTAKAVCIGPRVQNVG